jgi:hypothetical protein
LKPAAIVGWSGNGSQDDIARTALGKLPGKGTELSMGTRSLIIRGEDPVVVARRLAHLPGVTWIAVGYEFRNLPECTSRLSTLAKRYLEAGASFRVIVEADGSGEEEGDVLLEATSTLLNAAKGTRVDEKNPGALFRVIMVRGSGACGVQLRLGVGGVPTSKEMRASCLVSGGYHSSVTAWMAALSGYSLTLVHAKGDDESLRQVARLFAELSTRIDASSLRLEVLGGKGLPGDRVASWLGKARGEVFMGVHPECRGAAALRQLRGYRSAVFPLLLLQEAEVTSRFGELGLRGKEADRSAQLRLSRRRSDFTVRQFSGREADQNAVLDSVLG